VAELITQGIARRQTGTRFVTVRFGNVLGSNGSVVPRFIEQIKAGGPVTVTHPEMRRFFMLITEAVQLVLHAASLDERNDLYVLDMGDQIKLVDMARHLIRLLGYVPEEEIAIRMIGLRPGEKLCEELVAGYEVMEASSTEKVLRVRTKHPLNFPLLEAEVSEVSRLALHGESDAVLRLLCRIVPTFQPGAEWTEGEQWKAAGAVVPAPVGQAVLNVARAAV
jgi:FlaA1/EpsC-like NDP-sugar epimerase